MRPSGRGQVRGHRTLAKGTCRPLTPTLSPKRNGRCLVRQWRGEGEPRWLLWIDWFPNDFNLIYSRAFCCKRWKTRVCFVGLALKGIEY
jgi:hypothetical protein